MELLPCMAFMVLLWGMSLPHRFIFGPKVTRIVPGSWNLRYVLDHNTYQNNTVVVQELGHSL